MLKRKLPALVGAVLAVGFVLPAAAQDKIRIAFIDPLSGPMATNGDIGVKSYNYVMDMINDKGGVLGGKKFELVPFDNKLSPQESLVVLKNAIDQGIQYVTQGNGSSVAGALIDALNKHNERNPDKPVLYMNYAAVTPAFTNEKCSFWHFRWDAHADMKMGGLVGAIANDPSIKKVYLINQDYEFGHAVQKAAKDMLKQQRPDVQIVGDDLHPLGKVKDFSPYISKIQASGADAIISGNWGPDIYLLAKAAADAGLKAPFFTFYGGQEEVIVNVGNGAEGKIKVVGEWHRNMAVEQNKKDIEELYNDYEKKHKRDFPYGRVYNAVHMLAMAMEKAKSTDPVKVGLALEGMKFNSPFGEVVMRKEDHQLIQPLFVATLTKQVKYPIPGTEFGLKTDVVIPAEKLALPTTCKMQRPTS